MSVTVEQLEIALKEHFNSDPTIVVDVSDGCGTKFEIVVVSDHFIGMKILDRQRAVHDSIREYMPKIHAVTIRALTKEKYLETNNKK